MKKNFEKNTFQTIPVIFKNEDIEELKKKRKELEMAKGKPKEDGTGRGNEEEDID